VREAKQGSISFLKKRNKKLLSVGLRVRQDRYVPKREKVFWFFFSKKNCFLPLRTVARPGGFEPPTHSLEGYCSIQLS
jgi:hypothetical protein